MAFVPFVNIVHHFYTLEYAELFWHPRAVSYFNMKSDSFNMILVC